MIRALIIGNSHVAPLKLAADEVRDKLSSLVTFDFFAAHGPILSRLTREGDRFGAVKGAHLLPGQIETLRAINGTDFVDLDAYDCILIAGLPFRDDHITALLRDYQIDGLPASGGAKPRLSQAVFDACLAAAFDKPPYPFLFAEANRRQVSLLRRSRPVAGALTPEKAGIADKFWEQFAGEGDLIRAFFEAQDRSAARWCAERGIRLISQPASTLGKGGLTLDRFRKSTASLEGKTLEELPDPYHLNLDYGRLCLAEYLVTLPASGGKAKE